MTTTYMGLTLPTPGATLAPTWASTLNTAITAVDAHTHLSGSGQLIVTAALNINADLPFGGYMAKTLKASKYSDQSGTLSDLSAVYSVNGELYWNDAVGNKVAITSGGSINVGSLGAIGGMSATSAVTYSDTLKSYSFTQSAGITAKIACGDILLYENIAGAKAITIKSPASLAGAYSVTMPAVTPTANGALMVMSSAGDLTAIESAAVGLPLVGSGSGSTPIYGQVVAAGVATDAIETAKIKNLNITTAKIADGNVTQAKRAALGQQVSGSSAGYSSTSTVFIQPTNLSISITTTGRPVFLSLIHDGGSWAGAVGNQGGTDTYFRFNRDSTQVYHALVQSGAVMYLPPGSMTFIDSPAAGTYTYNFEGRRGGVSGWRVDYCKLIAYEL